MKKINFLIIAIMILTCCAPSPAKGELIKRQAIITSTSGSVVIEKPGGDVTYAAEGMKLTEGDVIKTRDRGSVKLFLEGTSETAEVELKPNTELKLQEFFEEKGTGIQRTLLDLAVGQILVASKKLQAEKSKFEVKTPTSIVGVRGTQFSVTVETE